MNKLYATLLIASLTFMHSANAQCKAKIDEFNHKLKVHSSEENIGSVSGFFNSGYKLKSQVYRVDDYIYLDLTCLFGSIHTFNKGDEVLLKTKNDSLIRLTIDETKVSDYGIYARLMWSVSYLFYLDEKLEKALLSCPIYKVRYGYQDYEINNDDIGTIAEQIKCVKNPKMPKK